MKKAKQKITIPRDLCRSGDLFDDLVILPEPATRIDWGNMFQSWASETSGKYNSGKSNHNHFQGNAFQAPLWQEGFSELRRTHKVNNRASKCTQQQQQPERKTQRKKQSLEHMNGKTRGNSPLLLLPEELALPVILGQTKKKNAAKPEVEQAQHQERLGQQDQQGQYEQQEQTSSQVASNGTEKEAEIGPKERYAEELSREISAFEKGLKSKCPDLTGTALRRLSLHNLLDQALRKEERSLSQVRVAMRADIQISSGQIIRSLVQALQVARNQANNLSAKERRRRELEAGLGQVLTALAKEMTQALMKGGICSMPNDCRVATHAGENDKVRSQEQNAEDSATIFARLVKQGIIGSHENDCVGPPLLRVQTAACQLEAMHSQETGFNPELELTALKALLEDRRVELEKSRQDMKIMDETIRALKQQVALGQRKRMQALEEARVTAYTRARDQHSAEIRRLKVEKDVLHRQLVQLTEKLKLMKMGAS